MLKKFKNKMNDISLQFYTRAVAKKAGTLNKKGEVNLIVILLLIAFAAAMVVLFRNTFQTILTDALNTLKDKISNLFG